MHADGRSARIVADIMQVPGAECRHGTAPRAPVADTPASRPRQRLPQVAAHDRERPARVAVIVEAGVLSWQPRQQPDLIGIGEVQPAVPMPGRAELDQAGPFPGIGRLADKLAELCCVELCRAELCRAELGRIELLLPHPMNPIGLVG